MYKFSQISRQRLNECHEDLIILFDEVIRYFDCSVITGYRNEDKQNKAFEDKKSKLRYPDSKHNKTPSLAIDVAPYPIDWDDIRRFYYFGGYVMATATQMFIDGTLDHGIRWGGDWDGDHEIKDQSFNDLVHFEILE